MPVRLDKTLPPTAPDDTIYIQRAPVRVPLNLGEWFPPQQLLEWITGALEGLQQTEPALPATGAPALDGRRNLLLTVLALAYAVQIFRNSEIVNACATDPTFINLCGGKPPYPEELEHFRRTHRTTLQTLLGLTLYQAVARRFDSSSEEFPEGFKRDLLIRAEERMDIARHMNTWDD